MMSFNSYRKLQFFFFCNAFYQVLYIEPVLLSPDFYIVLAQLWNLTPKLIDVKQPWIFPNTFRQRWMWKPKYLAQLEHIKQF